MPGQAEPPTEDTSPPAPDTPVSLADRIGSIDVLRGVAVLGIFLVNSLTFDMPAPGFMNPNLPGFDHPGSDFAYALVFMVAMHKFMPIFSMLFGAGILLFTGRVEARHGHSGRRWFARQGWLWAIGLVHGYVLWNGDILVPYAVVGLPLYLVRRWRTRTLAVAAAVCFLVPMAGMYGLGVGLEYGRGVSEEARLAEAEGQELTTKQEQFREIWDGTSRSYAPTLDDLAEVSETMRGGYGSIFRRNGSELLQQHLVMYPLLVNWNIAAYMMLGMILFRAGVLSASRSDAFYLRMLLLCYGVGLPATWLSMMNHHHHFSDLILLMKGEMQLHMSSGVLVALGHIALVMLVVRRGWLAGLRNRLGAAGRMAFTNYLSQTVLGCLLFYGYGLGLWGQVSRLALLGLVLAVWTLQLLWSPWWLGRYRFGPAEWLWRSLTYGQKQPLRRD